MLLFQLYYFFAFKFNVGKKFGVCQEVVKNIIIKKFLHPIFNFGKLNILFRCGGVLIFGPKGGSKEGLKGPNKGQKGPMLTAGARRKET